MAEHTERQGLGIREIIGDKREQVLALIAQYGGYNVRIFGSVARGEARPNSDVDFLVQFPEGTSMFDLVELWLDLQDLLGRDVSLITDDEDEVDPGRIRLLRRARKDAVPLTPLDEDFLHAAAYVLKKNEELYRCLARNA